MALVFVLQGWTTSEFAITPGNATPVAPLVTIRGVATNPRHDKIMLTDVYLQTLTAWQWILFHFQSHVQFINASQLVNPGIPTDELAAQGYLQMSDAKQTAEVAAFRALGWTVPARRTGTIITGIVANSPARAAGLHVGDEIVGVNGRSLASKCQLVQVVHHLAPGSALDFSVRRVQISNAGVLTWRRPTRLRVTTGATPLGVPPAKCPGISGADQSWLGVTLEDAFHYALPARVSINTANIGGPSAGLAMTLTIINELSAGSLTGHHVIAATGTMSVAGLVGDVGGVAEKTVAVQRAGASYFLVPEVEVSTARAAASPGLTILGVNTLTQALRDLRALGGAALRALTRPR